MTTLSKIYSDKETRDGIAVNKTYLVPVERLYLEPGHNIREADQEHVKYFADCWAAGSPIPALVVTPMADGRIKIEDGQHRYLGALMAISNGTPIARIECKDFTGDEADRVAFMISSSQGKPLDCFERAKAYVRLKGFGWTNEEIAKKVGRSISDIQMHLSLSDLPPEMKDRISQGQISYANAIQVNREHGSDAVKLVDEAIAEASEKGKSKITAKAIKPKKAKPVDRLIELMKPAELVLMLNEGGSEDAYLMISHSDAKEVLAILEQMK